MNERGCVPMKLLFYTEILISHNFYVLQKKHFEILAKISGRFCHFAYASLPGSC